MRWISPWAWLSFIAFFWLCFHHVFLDEIQREKRQKFLSISIKLSMNHTLIQKGLKITSFYGYLKIFMFMPDVFICKCTLCRDIYTQTLCKCHMVYTHKKRKCGLLYTYTCMHETCFPRGIQPKTPLDVWSSNQCQTWQLYFCILHKPSSMHISDEV